MGCDIHSYAEVKKSGRWEAAGEIFPFAWRGYGMFGFLANVRNYSHAPCIQEPTGEIPADASATVKDEWVVWESDGHSCNVLTLRQLAEYDYEQMFWDRRVTKQTGPNSWSGACLAEEGEGETVKLRDFLGADFFRDLEVLKTLGGLDDVRVVFWFDN